MDIMKKRAFALLIDGVLLGVYYETIRHVLPGWYFKLGSIGYAILLSVFFLKDIVFKNASIGKKIMGIQIFDERWENPSFFRLIKRSFMISTVGFAKMWKTKFMSGEILTIFDYEREKLGTSVIDNKVYFELKSQAEIMRGDFSKNMTDLYNEYLRSKYST